jgi:hypothetical protein
LKEKYKQKWTKIDIQFQSKKYSIKTMGERPLKEDMLKWIENQRKQE